MLDDRRNPADFIKLIHAVRDQPGREQNEQETSHLEETTLIKPDSARKEGPTQQSSCAHAQDRANQRLNNITR